VFIDLCVGGAGGAGGGSGAGGGGGGGALLSSFAGLASPVNL